jgi:hypothetical protein
MTKIEHATKERPDARQLIIDRVRELRKTGKYYQASKLEKQLLSEMTAEEAARYNLENSGK